MCLFSLLIHVCFLFCLRCLCVALFVAVGCVCVALFVAVACVLHYLLIVIVVTVTVIMIITPYKYHKKLLILDQTLKFLEEIGSAETLGKIS